MSEREITVNVTDAEIRKLTDLGFWKADPDGVLVLTDAANAWMRDWLSKQLEDRA